MKKKNCVILVSVGNRTSRCLRRKGRIKKRNWIGSCFLSDVTITLMRRLIHPVILSTYSKTKCILDFK